MVGHLRDSERQFTHVWIVRLQIANKDRRFAFQPYTDRSRKDVPQYAGIARQDGGDVRQKQGAANALFAVEQIAHFSSVASLTIRAAAWLKSSVLGFLGVCSGRVSVRFST